MARADVLVVEDQPLAAKDVEATLSVMDYDVVEIVRKGEDAIETAVEAEPEVVLMDILLAGEMDGIEAAQQIQDEHEIPVVFLTAHAEPETVGRAKQFGPYGYISKPVDPVELRTAIEVAIHKSELDEELKRSRIELTAFAHTVAHHLGEPLAAIDDRLDRVEASAIDQLEEGERDDLVTARREVDRAQSMVDGLLAYAEAGEAEPSQPHDVDEALDQVLAKLEPLIAETGARVEREPLPEVYAPEDKLVWLLGNLVENAIEHAHVDEPVVRVRSEEEDDHAVVAVEDNGMGIEPGIRDSIFDLFDRGQTQRPGAGVGLAVCKRIAEANRGGIWVESEPGEGSTFYARLPKGEEPAG
jgi:signal transduction histidine kinase